MYIHMTTRGRLKSTPLVRELHVAAVAAPRLLDGLDLILTRRNHVRVHFRFVRTSEETNSATPPPTGTHPYIDTHRHTYLRPARGGIPKLQPPEPLTPLAAPAPARARAPRFLGRGGGQQRVLQMVGVPPPAVGSVRCCGGGVCC